MSLPNAIYGSGIGKARQTYFGGYNHNLGAIDGEIYDMENMSSDLAPLLAPRRQRWYCSQHLTTPNGIYANDGLYWVDGTTFYAGGAAKGTVTNSEKIFSALGAYIIILPDMAYYNKLTDEFGSLNASWSGSAIIGDGSYAGETAAANTITAAGVDWADYFKPGDAVAITGAAAHPENNVTIVIREIDGDKLVFYPNSFTVGEGGDSETLSISRTAPELDFICENENRLWGCKGDTIYASKLGDPFNWNVFDGVSTDSYAVGVGSAGDFTACVSYLGYPIFFKEDQIYKVYGDRPSNFQVMGSASLGVESGSHKSLAVAGEVLFYLSRAGIVAYSGGIPQSNSEAFGTVCYHNGVGGSDGVKYFVSMEDVAGEWSLFVYDTTRGMWHREDDTQAVGWAYNEDLYCLTADGYMWLNGNARHVPQGASQEGAVQSMVEFGEFTEDNPDKKGTVKLQVRAFVNAGSSLSFYMMFDSSGEWELVDTLTAERLRTYVLPIVPRRSDHFKIKITGSGGWRLYSLTRNSYIGSELKSTPGRQ